MGVHFTHLPVLVLHNRRHNTQHRWKARHGRIEDWLALVVSQSDGLGAEEPPVASSACNWKNARGRRPSLIILISSSIPCSPVRRSL